MDLSENIHNIGINFHFLVIEVKKQVEDAERSLDDPANCLIDKVRLRDDHIDNLKSIIEKKTYLTIIQSRIKNKKLMDFTKALNIITANLERIGDFCVNVVDQLQYFEDPFFLKRYAYGPFFVEIYKAFDILIEAVFKEDMSLAIEICNREYNLDKLFKTCFETILKELTCLKETRNLVTTLFILRYLERIGDSLLNIGEAIISCIIGEKLKIYQIYALEETLSEIKYDYPGPDFFFETIAETKSGCKVGIVQLSDNQGKFHEVIFKEGKRYKIEKEYQNLIKWQSIDKGIVPAVNGYHVHGYNASLLLEKLEGMTFQDIIIKKDRKFIKNSCGVLSECMDNLWQKTKIYETRRSNMLKQLLTRFDDIMKVHPSFNNPPIQICDFIGPSFKSMVSDAFNKEKMVNIPFLVFVHGDFNIDNIICDTNMKIHYVDFYRSEYSDYLQDIAVFIVSAYRLPFFDLNTRARINETIDRIFEFSQNFAKLNEDTTFQFRLALGIIRSFLTSTRFQLNDKFARSMYARAIYLLTKINDFDIGRGIENFSFPRSILYY